MLFEITKVISNKQDLLVELDSSARETIENLRRTLYDNSLRNFMLSFIPSYLENPNIETLKIVVEEQVNAGMKVMLLEFDFLTKPIHLINAKLIIDAIKKIVPNIILILPKAFVNFNNQTEINLYDSTSELFLKLEERYNEQVRFSSESNDGFDKFMERIQGQTDQTIFKF